ncbi:DUF4148 domain-containing protein [Rhodoferax sp. PAMC 29310]|uniref:DUF4148 domain-containing protein n=1 Tax=Rhodoferax sp. PAMC 29310 TaxID=2822760 RepID=UPI001B33A981|nr:DUF4148 domain-containing protein [Rhodoferax sp. PAMC 29310]
MNRKYISSLALALAALAAGNAFAADASAPLTREQVRAELVQAQRTGDLLAVGDRAQKLNELNPAQYPAKSETTGNTREQVKAELAEAQRTGDILATDNSGKKLNEINPSQYPAKEVAQNTTRAAVMADVAKAQARGALLTHDTNSNS